MHALIHIRKKTKKTKKQLETHLTYASVATTMMPQVRSPTLMVVEERSPPAADTWEMGAFFGFHTETGVTNGRNVESKLRQSSWGRLLSSISYTTTCISDESCDESFDMILVKILVNMSWIRNTPDVAPAMLACLHSTDCDCTVKLLACKYVCVCVLYSECVYIYVYMCKNMCVSVRWSCLPASCTSLRRPLKCQRWVWRQAQLYARLCLAPNWFVQWSIESQCHGRRPGLRT